MIKRAESLTRYRSFFLEAMVMHLFAEYPSGFQRLVGLCPEELGLMTKFAGRSLEDLYKSQGLEPDHSSRS